MRRPTAERPVVVVGGGISGIACARALHDAGLPVRVVDRGRRLGGRMAVRTEVLEQGPHAVDIGASYFTVRDPRFDAVVQRWRAAGLAREWTTTLTTLDAAGLGGGSPTANPVVEGTTATPIGRWSAGQGLRSLVESLAEGLDVSTGVDVARVQPGGAQEDGAQDGVLVDAAPATAVVLAMPDPQARAILPAPVSAALELGERADWAPSIAVWAAWDTRWWPDLDGAFVHGSSVIAWIADDGRRRGDGAPVLVAHTTAEFAAARLDDPRSAARPVLDELIALLGARADPGPAVTSAVVPGEPRLLRAHRWSLALPGGPHRRPFALTASLIGVCGDAWGPQPRVEQAWLSGHLLGTELVGRLT